MSRYRTRTHTARVDVEVDIDDVLSELDDDELEELLQKRRMKQRAPTVHNGPEGADWDRLVDLIAAGETRDALFLLRDLRKIPRINGVIVQLDEGRRKA